MLHFCADPPGDGRVLSGLQGGSAVDDISTAVTEICIRPGRDYAPRVRRIVQCVAESLGMNAQQAGDAEAAVAEAYANALNRGIIVGPAEGLRLRFRACECALIAELSGGCAPRHFVFETTAEKAEDGEGPALVRSLAECVEFSPSGATLRITKVVDRHTED